MNKTVITLGVLCLVLVGSVMFGPLAAAAPPIKRPADLYILTVMGGYPETVDYSWCYDTASAQIIMNTMDTLIAFNGEHVDQYVPSVASSWSLTPLNGGLGVDSGLPVSGLTFENGNQTGADAAYYYRYDFTINNSVYFQPPYSYYLTPSDVAYSFQRTMVQDRLAGPQWMIQEALLDNSAGDDASFGGIADLTNETQVHELGVLIENSVQFNSTDVWFNIMFPSTYPPFLQILCQPWSSIESKQWINLQVIGMANRPDWSGDWSRVHTGWALDHTEWVDHHNPSNSPLDYPAPMEYGSGPFRLVTLAYIASFWQMTRYAGYFRGWPADRPNLIGTTPAGYVNTIEESWAFTWYSRREFFLNGDADFVAVPSYLNICSLYQSSSPPFDPPNYPLNGVRCVHPLYELEVGGFLFTFNIDRSTVYGSIGPPGVFDPNSIPSDFFGNPDWGIHVRRAFAYAFDYNSYIEEAWLNEATAPATAIIPGLTYNDPSVTGYTYNITQAQIEAQHVKSGDLALWTTGFTIDLVYLYGDSGLQTACEHLATDLQNVNPKFHVNLVEVSMPYYISAAVCHQLPIFVQDWRADFPDAHNFAYTFYDSSGPLAECQAYSNSTMNSLVEQGILTSNGTERAQIYHDIQVMAVQDVPSFMIYQPYGRLFERDWINGYYYNPVYTGTYSLSGYFYNVWKWYYCPEALDSSQTQPHGYCFPADANYDGKVDMKDIGIVSRAYGSVPYPMSSTWNFRADINNDRRVDMKDIGYIGRCCGETSPVWTAQFSVSISPVTAFYNATTPSPPVTFTATVLNGTAPYSYQWYTNVNGTFQQVTGATSSTYVFTPPSTPVPNTIQVYVMAADSSEPAQYAQSQIATVFVVA